MKMMIPPEIKRRTMRKMVIRIAVFVGILVLFGAAFLFWRPLAELDRNNKAITFYVCVLFDMLVTGVPLKWIGGNWQGEVLNVKEKTTTETSNPSKPTSSSWYTANTFILTLKTPKGDIITKKAEQTSVQYLQKGFGQYEKGDYAARIRGADYPAHYKAASNETRCVICGSYSSNDLHKCERCGNALVTFTQQTAT